jgi:hypothetical protein
MVFESAGKKEHSLPVESENFGSDGLYTGVEFSYNLIVIASAWRLSEKYAEYANHLYKKKNLLFAEDSAVTIDVL